MSENLGKFTIFLRCFLCWVLVNIIIATFPIWIFLLKPFVQEQLFFSSILSYVFTFLIASLYVYMAIINKIHSPEMITMWITIPIILVVWGCYVIFNCRDDFSMHIKLNLSVYVTVILLVTGILGVWLHWPYLKEQINEEFADNQKVLAKKTRENVKNMKDSL